MTKIVAQHMLKCIIYGHCFQILYVSITSMFKGGWTRRRIYGSKILSCSGLKIVMEHAH